MRGPDSNPHTSDFPSSQTERWMLYSFGHPNWGRWSQHLLWWVALVIVLVVVVLLVVVAMLGMVAVALVVATRRDA